MRHLATFHPLPLYDFEKTIAASRFYTTLGTWRDGVYWRALRAGHGLALVAMQNRGTPDAPAVETFVAASEGDVDTNALWETVGRMLNLTVDMRPFYALAQTDPALWQLVEPLVGLHILQTETMFEALVITTIEQQIALAAAQRGERWLVDRFGTRITFAGETFHTFPSPVRLAQTTVDELTPLKITFRRMRVLIDVAALALPDSLEWLRDLPAEEAYAALVRLRGVGHWTAAWTLTRGSGRFLYFGSADVALRAAVNRYFYGEPGRAERDVTDATFARYGDHAGLAAFYTIMKWAVDKYGGLRVED